MIKGQATMHVTHDTIREALQQYFARETFRDGVCPRVVTIEAASRNGYDDGEFKVTLAEAEKSSVAAEGGAS